MSLRCATHRVRALHSRQCQYESECPSRSKLTYIRYAERSKVCKDKSKLLILTQPFSAKCLDGAVHHLQSHGGDHELINLVKA